MAKPLPGTPKPHKPHKPVHGGNNPDDNNDSPTGGSGSGSGSSASDQYAASQHRAAKAYLQDIHTIQVQARHLRAALSSDGFRAALQTQLEGVRTDQKQADAILLRNYRNRNQGFRELQDNAEIDQSQTAFLNLSNTGRERLNALNEAMLQGAGESDVLASQGAALRNWSFNAAENNRAFYDQQTGVNNSIRDNTADTLTARADLVRSSNQQRAQYWTSYYSRMNETATQLGNLYGTAARDAQQSNAQENSKKAIRLMHKYNRKADQAFNMIDKMAGAAYENPGIPKRIRNWDGAPLEDTHVNGKGIRATVDLGKPEGATLRSWAE